MIFTQADRQNLENIPAVLSALRIQLEHRDKQTLAILNELGAALGRIESRVQAIGDVAVGGIIDLRADVSRVSDAQKYSYDRLQTELEKSISEVQQAVNRRADEALDTMRGRSDMVNNAIVALSGRVTTIEKSNDELLQTVTVLADGSKLVVKRLGELADAWNKLTRAIEPESKRKARRKKK